MITPLRQRAHLVERAMMWEASDPQALPALDRVQACPWLQLLLHRMRLATGGFGTDDGEDGSPAA
jgi:hypothetical protein